MRPFTVTEAKQANCDNNWCNDAWKYTASQFYINYQSITYVVDYSYSSENYKLQEFFYTYKEQRTQHILRLVPEPSQEL